MDPSQTNNRDPGIDVLRGLSIVLVVCHHLGLRVPLGDGVLTRWMPEWLSDVVTGRGYEAVFVFFVISGFLIASKALARWNSLGALDARAFYVRRAARILPCLVALVVVLALLDRAGVGHYVVDRPGQSLGRAVVAALGLHLNWYEGVTGYLPASWDVLWSLSIEEVFYLGFPLVALGTRRWPERVVLLVLLAFALTLPLSRGAIVGDPVWREKAYLPGMAAIALGVVAALLSVRVRRGGLPRVVVVRTLLAVGSVALAAVFVFEGEIWGVIGQATVLAQTIATAMILVALSWRRPSTAPWRSLAWLRSFGRRSYEVYLGHMFAVWPVVDLARRFDPQHAADVGWFVLALALSWLLGSAVARWFSIPAQAWVADRFSRRSGAIVVADAATG